MHHKTVNLNSSNNVYERGQMKKYIIIVVMTCISISSLRTDVIEADVTKNSLEVGFTFVDNNAENGVDTKSEEKSIKNIYDNKEKLPNTGDAMRSDLILLGLFSILLALFLKEDSKNKDR